MAFEPPKSCQMIFPDSKMVEFTKSSTDLTSKSVLSKSIFHAILPFLLPSEKSRILEKSFLANFRFVENGELDEKSSSSNKTI